MGRSTECTSPSGPMRAGVGIYSLSLARILKITVARISSMPSHMASTPAFLSRKLKPTASMIIPMRIGMSMPWNEDIVIMATALSKGIVKV
ncbi:hypothetical protein EMIT0P218_310032 [Pseudomonas sp. IT-P218]